MPFELFKLTFGAQGANTEENDNSKKPRRSSRITSATTSQPQRATTPVSKKKQLPTPITHADSISSTEAYKETTATPPEGRPSQIQHHPYEHHAPMDPPGFSSPPQDTQAFSQFTVPSNALSDEVVDEAEEGVWGYLLPTDLKYGKSLVLKKRNACPLPDSLPEFGKDNKNGKAKNFAKEEEAYEQTKVKGVTSGGYLIGRHPECGTLHDRNTRIEANHVNRPHHRRPHCLEPTLPSVRRDQGWKDNRGFGGLVKQWHVR